MNKIIEVLRESQKWTGSTLVGTTKVALKSAYNSSSIINNLIDSFEAGCTFLGALENALTSAINEVDPVGGWSVKIEKNEIFIFQHSGAGEGEETFKF